MQICETLLLFWHQPSFFTDSFNDLLAGQEYTQILISVVEHVDNLAVISSLQEEYLEESKKYTEGSPNSALMQAAREKWFDDVSVVTCHKTVLDAKNRQSFGHIFCTTFNCARLLCSPGGHMIWADGY